MRPHATLLAILTAMTPMVANAQVQQPSGCEEGFQSNGENGCVPVAALPGVDALGLPTGVAVTNFAPAALPLVAGLGAALVAGIAGADGSSGTNGTNGTN